MTNLLPRKSSLHWLPVSTEPVYLCLVSEVHVWYSHWSELSNRSARCTGENCAQCLRGKEPEIRYVVAGAIIRDPQKILQREIVGQLYFFEMRQRHLPIIDDWMLNGPGVPGQVIQIRKLGNGKSAPVEIESQAHFTVSVIDISGEVATLGNRRVAK